MATKFGYECPDSKGKELEFGSRADLSNLNKFQAKKFWQGYGNVIYELEAEVIKSEIAKRINEQFKGKSNSTINLKEIQDMWENMKKEIDNKYVHTQGNEKLSEQKKKYVKETMLKSYRLGIAFNIMLWMSILLEMFVILAQAVAMSIAEGGYIDAPSIVIAMFMGILLAIGGWSIGIFLGVWWFDIELENKNIGEEHINLAHWFVLAIGIILILFVAITRMLLGGGILYLVISIILGMLVAIFKGFKEFYEGLRCFTGKHRLIYYRIEASDLHSRNMKVYEHFFNDTIKEMSNKYNITIEEV